MKKIKYHEITPCRDFRDLLYSSEKLYGPNTAFLEKKDGVWIPTTYTAFRDEVNAFGTELYHMGLGGKRIIVIGENCYHWALTYMTVLCGAGVIVPVDRENSPEEISNIVRLSEASAMFYAPSMNAKIAACDLPENFRAYCFTEIPSLVADGQERLLEGDEDFLNCEIRPDIMSVLLFTSGTTGVSKGVMLSQENICFDLSEITAMLDVRSDDVALSVLPLHHTYECTCGFLSVILKGGAIAYCERLSLVAKNMNEVRASLLIAVPALLEAFYKKIWHSAEKSGKANMLRSAIKQNNRLKKLGIDLSSKLFAEIHKSLGGRLRLISCGGAAADPGVMRGMRELGFLTVQGYGLTECSPLAAVNSDRYYRDDSAGLCIPHGEISIVDADENGVGEVRFRGKNVMLGYYRNPELTAQVKIDGWFYTGDLGYLDSDGFLHLTGRKKNVIVTANGKNIFPEEIEVYLERNPLLAESMVLGEITETGETIVKAIVYPNFELADQTLSDSGITHDSPSYPEELKKLISAAVNEVNLGLPPFKRIRRFTIRTRPFDKTSTRKIRRTAQTNLSDPGDIA